MIWIAVALYVLGGIEACSTADPKYRLTNFFLWPFLVLFAIIEAIKDQFK